MADNQFMPKTVSPFVTKSNEPNNANVTESWFLQYGIILKCFMTEPVLTTIKTTIKDSTKSQKKLLQL